ncbi:putative galacturonan 1,4-alpha-galacturonidase [Helianthus annuus]|nr:putative galacturonan 1,4-alpha-galacturonidase [Helianthus annuus]
MCAFLGAWYDACGREGGGRVLVPRGTYKIDSVVDFTIKGSLEASSNPKKFFVDHWIGFRYIDRLTVGGGGFLHGHGGAAWHHNECATNSQCNPLPVVSSFF